MHQFLPERMDMQLENWPQKSDDTPFVVSSLARPESQDRNNDMKNPFISQWAPPRSFRFPGPTNAKSVGAVASNSWGLSAGPEGWFPQV